MKRARDVLDELFPQRSTALTAARPEGPAEFTGSGRGVELLEERSVIVDDATDSDYDSDFPLESDDDLQGDTEEEDEGSGGGGGNVDTAIAEMRKLGARRKNKRVTTRAATRATFVPEERLVCTPVIPKEPNAVSTATMTAQTIMYVVPDRCLAISKVERGLRPDGCPFVIATPRQSTLTAALCKRYTTYAKQRKLWNTSDTAAMETIQDMFELTGDGAKRVGAALVPSVGETLLAINCQRVKERERFVTLRVTDIVTSRTSAAIVFAMVVPTSGVS